MTTLVISEKANAADRIAYFLSNGSKKTQRLWGVKVHSFDYHGEEFVVIGLRGHVVAFDYEKKMNDWRNTDLKELIWTEPSRQVTEGSIVKAVCSQRPSNVIIATDYDREGELIGVEALDVIQWDHTRAHRAKFSALTSEEIHHAFNNLVPIDKPLADAGMARQYIDLAWGAVLTRFMSRESNRMGKDFLSVGRVQSPTLALIVDREKEILSFVPTPFWNVVAGLGGVLTADHVKNPFWEEGEAVEACNNAKKADTALVKAYEKNEDRMRPPPPFNTTSFISEATKLGMGARQAMDIAEELYISGWISYPRTDNTVYPRSLSLKSVLKKLQSGMFSREAGELLKQDRIRATRGRVETTDHPPIYPVRGAAEGELQGFKLKIYELVARRFMATVAPDAKLAVSHAEFDLSGETFEANGKIIVDQGWVKYYPYARINETRLPELVKGEKLVVDRVNRLKKMTRPPPRYNQGSIIQEMERFNLGTKSTRHEIVQKLFDRGYLRRPMIPTPTGIALVDSLRESAEEITHPDMTATLESEMDAISVGKKDLAVVVEDSRTMLTTVLDSLNKKKKEVYNTMKDASMEEKRMGACPLCGGDLMVLKPGKKRFVGCSNYPSCKNTYPLPQQGRVVSTDKICKTCDDPVVRILNKGRSPWEICLNINCASKDKDRKSKKGGKGGKYKKRGGKSGGKSSTSANPEKKENE